MMHFGLAVALLAAVPPDPFASDAQPEPAPVQPAPGDPAAAPTGYTPPPAPAPTGPVALEPPQTGLGLLIAGPLTVAAGIPFSFLGNTAWRSNCGPTSSDRECLDGSFASGGAHTLTGFAYTAGIVMTGVGGARRGQFAAAQDPTRDGVGYIIGGAVLLPASLIGMGMTRLMLWLPTPDCLTATCVQKYQNLSTVIVGGLAMSASLSAGLLMYGAGYNRARPRMRTSVAVLPQASRGYAGLSLTGQF